MPLLMYCIYTLIGALGNLFSLLTIDRTGRRFALITGFSGCLVALVLETAMVATFVEGAASHSTSSTLAGQRVAIFAIMFFVFFYGLFIDAASFIYSSEIYPTNIRSRGVALATTTYFIGCITYVTPGATAIANVGYKYFVVFICLTAVMVLVLGFAYPETKGKSLEELAELFGDKVVVRLTDASEAEKREIDNDIRNEKGFSGADHVERI